MGTKCFPVFATCSALLSIVAWTYRFIDEYSRSQEIAFYLLVPLVCWGLFIGFASLIMNKKVWVRVVAGILLIPFSLLWMLSVWVGFYGLKIH